MNKQTILGLIDSMIAEIKEYDCSASNIKDYCEMIIEECNK